MSHFRKVKTQHGCSFQSIKCSHVRKISIPLDIKLITCKNTADIAQISRSFQGNGKNWPRHLLNIESYFLVFVNLLRSVDSSNILQ